MSVQVCPPLLLIFTLPPSKLATVYTQLRKESAGIARLLRLISWVSITQVV